MVCPGLCSTQGSEIDRIGVIVHKMGNFIGLPDLYGSGTPNDAGIGAYDGMINSWGSDNSQLYPPNLSPWSKVRLGWSHPTTVSQNGDFNITASVIMDQVYRINLGPSEYLLIKNR
jgi:M6 family metalloprotease-like protein